MWLDVSTGGELHVASRRACRPSAWCCTATTSPTRSCAAALDAGVGRIVVDSFDELDRLERDRRGGATGVLLRVTPGVEAHTHEYVRTGQDDSKFGFGLASGAAAEAVGRASARAPRCELVGMHAHIGSQIFLLESFDAEVAGLGRLLRAARPRRAVHRRRPRRAVRRGRVGARPSPSGPRRCAGGRAAAGVPRSVPDHRRAGPSHRRRRRRHPVHGRHDQAAPRHPDLRQRGRRA